MIRLTVRERLRYHGYVLVAGQDFIFIMIGAGGRKGSQSRIPVRQNCRAGGENDV